MSSTVCPWSQSQPASSSTQPEASQRSSQSHAHSLLAQMNKMRERAELCDVRLVVGGQVFQVHRVVLAASGPYFSALFNSAMSEAGEGEVHIEGVEPQVFHHLLKFIYTGVVELTVENVQDVLMAADMLQLSELVDICGDFMRCHMEVGNCVPMFQFLQQICSTPLLDFTQNYICAHFLQVCELDEFLTLTKGQLLLLLHSEELRIEEEFQVFIAAMRWLQHDLTNRKKHLVEVLEPIRCPLLSPQRLSSFIEGVGEFSLRVALQTLLREYTEITKSPKDCKPLPQPNKLRPRKKARKYLYAIGGYTRLQGGRWSDSRALSCVERFDSFSQFWTTVSSLHQARSGVGVAVLEGVVYVVGGEKDSMIFDCTERYDPITKQWSSGASLNYPRCGVGLCSCHGALYALGGWIGSEIGKSMERFDPEENKWEVMENMPIPRYYFGCCELQGFIYVVGGISDEGVELRSAEVYDPIGRRWRALPDMSIRRAYLGVAPLNGIVYAVGGWNEELGSLDTVEKYCPQEERWVELAPLTVPRAGLSVAAVGGLLYAVGGRSTGRGFSAPVTVDSVEIYDPNLDTWTEMGNMITSRCDGGVAVL